MDMIRYHRIFYIVLTSIIMSTGCTKREKSNYLEHLALGNRYLEDMDYENAAIAFQTAIKIEPKILDGYIELADVYIALEQQENALNILLDGADIYNTLSENERTSEQNASYRTLQEKITALTLNAVDWTEKETAAVEPADSPVDKEQMQHLIKEAFSGQIRGYSYNDFDGDGRQEMFAYGFATDANTYAVWFCNSDGTECREVYRFRVSGSESVNGFYCPREQAEKKRYFCVPCRDGEGIYSKWYIFGIENKEPILLHFDETSEIEEESFHSFIDDLLGISKAEDGSETIG